MAVYDVLSNFYDDGLMYDSVPPPPTTRKHMAKVKMNLSKLSDAQVVQLAIDSNLAMTGNTDFTNIVPSVAAMTALIATGQAKITTASAAQQAAQTATSEKNAAIDAIKAAMTQRGASAESLVAGDPVKLQGGGFQIKGESVPVGIPTTVTGIAITAGDNDGELDVQWDPVRGANSYEIQVSVYPPTSNSWSNKPSVTKSKAVLTGLTSGQRTAVRVRAIGSAGPGDWSLVADKTVP